MKNKELQILVGHKRINPYALAEFFERESELSNESLVFELNQLKENLLMSAPPELPTGELRRSHRLLSSLATLFQDMVIE